MLQKLLQKLKKSSRRTLADMSDEEIDEMIRKTRFYPLIAVGVSLLIIVLMAMSA